MREETLTRRTSATVSVRPRHPGERLSMDGVWFDNIDGETALAYVEQLCRTPAPDGPHVVFFVNVHSLSVARRDPALRRVLREADLVLPDGSGLAIAGMVAGLPVRENLNGTDFTPRVLGQAERVGWAVYLLGGRSDVIHACRERLLERFPGLRICGVDHGHFGPDDEPGILERIAAARPDVLLVGMGTPAQELWIMRNRAALKSSVVFAVGGLFDFLSGQKPRAPGWMRRLGIEWVYRFLKDPATKWDRVLLEIPLFLIRALGGQVPVHRTAGQHVMNSRGGE